MHDFLNRVDAQRLILESINSRAWSNEPLMSLSGKSIARWIERNNNEPPAGLIQLLKLASEKLFFLANKSQEQITEDYKSLSIEVFHLAEEIKNKVKKM